MALDKAYIQAPNPECNQTPGSPFVGGNGSTGCIEGWLTQVSGPGEVGPPPPPGSVVGSHSGSSSSSSASSSKLERRAVKARRFAPADALGPAVLDYLRAPERQPLPEARRRCLRRHAGNPNAARAPKPGRIEVPSARPTIAAERGTNRMRGIARSTWWSPRQVS